MSESVRLMFTIIAEQDLEMLSLDVKTAFLYAPVPTGQSILMRRPNGLSDEDMPECVSLNKFLYGLPMAPAQFCEHSDTSLRTHGFAPLISDPRIYMKLLPDGETYMFLYMWMIFCVLENQWLNSRLYVMTLLRYIRLVSVQRRIMLVCLLHEIVPIVRLLWVNLGTLKIC